MDWTPLIILAGFFAFMYMFIIRPQRQRQKEMKELLDSLTPGRDVITIGGIHGRIVTLDEKTVDLKVADGTVITFDRETVGRLVEEDEETV